MKKEFDALFASILHSIEDKKEEQDKNDFLCHLNQNEKSVAVELTPPFSLEIDKFFSIAKRLKKEEIDILHISDAPLAKPRLDSFMMAAKIESEIGINTCPHLTCRDKNELAVTSSLMSGHIEGIRNAFIISGDKLNLYGIKDYSRHLNFMSFDLLNYIHQLNDKMFSKEPYGLGAALNINSDDFDNEMIRAIIKSRNGADYFITQSAFTDTAIKNIKKAKNILEQPILVSIYPIMDFEQALFLQKEVSGVKLEFDLLEKYKAATPKEGEKMGLELAIETIEKTKNLCNGYLFSGNEKNIEVIIKLIQYVKGRI